MKQGQIRSHAQHGVLGGVQMHIAEGLKQQPVPIVNDPGLQPFRDMGEHCADGAVFLQKQTAMGEGFQLSRCRGVQNVAFEQDHDTASFYAFTKEKAPV